MAESATDPIKLVSVNQPPPCLLANSENRIVHAAADEVSSSYGLGRRQGCTGPRRSWFSSCLCKPKVAGRHADYLMLLASFPREELSGSHSHPILKLEHIVSEKVTSAPDAEGEGNARGNPSNGKQHPEQPKERPERLAAIGVDTPVYIAASAVAVLSAILPRVPFVLWAVAQHPRRRPDSNCCPASKPAHSSTQCAIVDEPHASIVLLTAIGE